MPSKREDDILEAQIYESSTIKVGTFRTLFFMIPSAIVAYSLGGTYDV